MVIKQLVPKFGQFRKMFYLCKSVKEISLIIYAPPNGARGTSAPLFKFLDYEYRL